MMSRSTQTYVHPPLKNKSSIRLVKLLPGESETPLRCEVFEVDDTSKTQYEALSYAWADDAVPEDIEIRGMIGEGEINRTIPITKSLFEALRRLRSDGPRTLWVDALCINQDDLEEKGRQVAHMGHIYRNASCVVVWLGEDRRYPRTAALLEQDGKNRWPLTVPENDLGELVTVPW